ncbi:hypothetical protein [Corynebacterium epidermidicanis]|uniref:Uncharacterized protein n=1 Tax=Corynebacterium epidermidicanis TaxID=1050174 RepID=A0A0G3GXL2_9CORY|nr:hypothetical protein [Corynebacterium epidermidicanis]AKK04258.1 hypothetical protein CEPID_12175 [Corynebacterium epidermidicanis]
MKANIFIALALGFLAVVAIAYGFMYDWKLLIPAVIFGLVSVIFYSGWGNRR